MMDPEAAMSEILDIMSNHGMDSRGYESAEELPVKDLMALADHTMELLNWIHDGGVLPSNLEEAAGRE